MGAKAKQLRDDLIRRVKDYPDSFEPETFEGGDCTIVRPRRVEKKFSKSEIIDLIIKSYKHL